MRIRRWPFVIGTTVLFGGTAVGCGSQSQSQPFVSASEQQEELAEVAVEETSTDTAELGSDIADQEAADASGEDGSTPADAAGEDNAEEGGETAEEGGETAEEGGETAEEGGEMATEEGGETAEEGGETTEEGGEMATEEGGETTEEGGETMEDGGEGGSEELPKIGDKCDGDPFGGEAGVCAGDPPEPVLICSGGVYEDAANFSDLCSCEDMDGDGNADEVVCLSPGFVGIQRSGRKRVATRRLRRA